MNIADDTLSYLMNKMGIESTDSIIPGGRYHNRRDYMNFPSLGREDLLYKPIEPLPIPGLILQTSLFAIKKPRIHFYKEVPDGLEFLRPMESSFASL